MQGRNKKSNIPIPARAHKVPKPPFTKKPAQALEQKRQATRVDTARIDATDTSRLSIKSTKSTVNKATDKKPYEVIQWKDIIAKVNSFIGKEVLEKKIEKNGIPEYVTAFNEIMKYFPEAVQLSLPSPASTAVLKSILPEYLTVMGYPHIFRNFETIGSKMGNRPFFYSLYWMVCLLEADNDAGRTNASLAPGFDMNFFNLILEFYPRFMESQSQDDVFSEVASEIEALFRDRTEQIENERAELEEAIASANNQLTSIESNSAAKIADLKRKISEKDKEIQSLSLEINSANHEVARLESEQETLLRDLDTQQKLGANIDKELAELERRSSALEIDRETIERLSRESAEVARALEAATAENAELDGKVREAYDEIEGARGFISDLFDEWNGSAARYGFERLGMKPDFESNKRMIDDFHTFLLEKRPLKGAAESAAERIENELQSLRAQKEKLEKEAAALSRDMPNFIPSKTKFDADDLQRKIRDLEAEEAQNQLRYKEEMREAESKLQEATDAFDSYQAEVAAKFGELLHEIQALNESY